MKPLFYFLIFFLFSCQLKLFSQRSIGGKPISFYQQLSTEIPSIIIPSIDIDSILTMDSINQSNGEFAPYRYGYPVSVNIGLTNSGKWTSLLNGDRIWQLKIISENAKTINLTYNLFWLPSGALFYIYNEQKTDIIGGFTEKNNKPYKQFSTALVKGDVMILELYEPLSVIGRSELNIDRVIYGFKNPPPPDPLLPCHIGVNCPDGNNWCIEKKSIAMIVDNAGGICSGVLLNNATQDLKPYLLSAEHCLASTGNLYQWTFYFNNWDNDCIDGNYNDNAAFSVSGATLKSNNTYSDFMLLELNEQPISGSGVHYAGWSKENIIPTSGVVMHHPKGKFMKISLYGNESVSRVIKKVDVTYETWKVYLDKGITEPGSSGGPLFNQNHKVIGQLIGPLTTNIIPNCYGPRTMYFGRFDLSWNYGTSSIKRLQDWLDASNTLTEVDATGPPIYLLNKTYSSTSGVKKVAAIHTLQLQGNISTSGSSYCPPSNQTFIAESGSKITFNGKERVIIKPGVRFKAGSKVRVQTGEVDCSYEYVKGDFIADRCTTNVVPITNKKDADIIIITESIKDKKNTNQIINNKIIFTLYPNPNTGKFTLTMQDEEFFEKNAKVTIYDLLGQTVYQQTLNFKHETLNTQLSKGIYVVKVELDNEVWVEKMVVMVKG